jgi:hypothetical protein
VIFKSEVLISKTQRLIFESSALISNTQRLILLMAVSLDVEEAWASEIQRRVAAARAGELASTDWRTVLARVEREVFGR